MQTKLADAPRLFGPQKGATPDDVAELERAFAGHPHGAIPGSGAAGGLGAALSSLGAELVPGAELVLDLIGFDPTGYDLVVTGEGTVDETTYEGKAPRSCNGAASPRGRAACCSAAACSRPRRYHSRATLNGPMWISLSWVCGSVWATPRIDVEAPELSGILVSALRTVVLVAPNGLA